MKLKVKSLNLIAGRPIVFIHEKDSENLNAHVGDRVSISLKNRKTIAMVDIAMGILKTGEIGVSQEIIKNLKLKNNDIVEVGLTLIPKSIKIILKKMSGRSLSKEEIEILIKDLVSNALTEAELAYFVSGVYEKGMSLKETIYLTEAIYKTGERITWHTSKIADKHSIGGVAGNRTTPIVVSICAAAGIVMPKTSSRAITSAAGTADVVESIARVDFPISKLKEIVKKTNACLAWGGSLGLAPADDKIIQVERMVNLDPEPQLLASVIAKKLAVGSKYILIDIPYGNGAKVTKASAIKLRQKFLKIGRYFKLKMKIVLTDGSQPIGNGIGPILEIKDIIKVLKRDNSPKDLEEKSIALAGEIIEMVGKTESGKGAELAREILDSGKAFEKFKEIIKAQEGSINHLKEAGFKEDILAKKNGKITHIDNKKINNLGRLLGCPADKAAGIYIYKHKGEIVKTNEKILTLYSESKVKLNDALAFLRETNPLVLG